jgi:hypothetical protein
MRALVLVPSEAFLSVFIAVVDVKETDYIIMNKYYLGVSVFIFEHKIATTDE